MPDCVHVYEQRPATHPLRHHVNAKDQAAALKLSLESAFKEMASLRKTLAERDDEAKEEELIKVQKIKKELQEELRRNKELAIAEKDSLQRTIDECPFLLRSCPIEYIPTYAKKGSDFKLE